MVVAFGMRLIFSRVLSCFNTAARSAGQVFVTRSSWRASPSETMERTQSPIVTIAVTATVAITLLGVRRAVRGKTNRLPAAEIRPIARLGTGINCNLFRLRHQTAAATINGITKGSQFFELKGTGGKPQPTENSCGYNWNLTQPL